MRPDRETALRILRKHNKDETHVRHALAVEGTMRHFARRAGADEDLWGVVGILHDVDWEMTSDAPERHLTRSEERRVGKECRSRWSPYIDRKSTRLNSSHMRISYAVFCLKKKKKNKT